MVGKEMDVIIPVYRPGRELFTLLDALEGQTLRPRQILLMNTERKYFEELTAGTDFEKKYPNVQVYHLSKREFDHGGTRRRGVEHSQAEIFAFMTQDAVPADERLLEELAGALEEGVATAYARQLPGPGSSLYERISRQFNYPDRSRVKRAADLEELGIKTFFCSNVCAAYRRDVYQELGGFLPRAIFNEDMIYAAGAVRAGWGVAYAARARVIHSHSYTNLQQLRRNFDLGVSQADHPEVFGAVASEAEGKKMIQEAFRYLKKKKLLYKFPGFGLQCCFKYAGYLLGKNYRRLPRGWILGLTSNKEYWLQG